MTSLMACDKPSSEHIQWQLPLAAPADPHGADHAAVLPQWATNYQGSAKIVWLKKPTARTGEFEVSMGDETSQGDLHITLLGLAHGLRLKSGTYIEDKNVQNPAAFVEVSLKGKQVYRGWLYQEFPELFGPDMKNWKLSLNSIRIAVSEEE